jgi:hypothetical protein
MSTPWYGPLFVSRSHGRYVVRPTLPIREALPPRAVVQASGPAPLPPPSRALDGRELAAWVRAWRLAGYRFRVLA